MRAPLLLLPAAALGARADPCVVNVRATQGRHRINPRVMGCHSDSGYAHEAIGLRSELIYGQAFEKVPDGPYHEPPKPPTYPCKYIGKNQDFAGADVSRGIYSGKTDEEKDASCCGLCDCTPDCDYWVRDTAGDTCWLKNNFRGFSGNEQRRGNFRNASGGACEHPPSSDAGHAWLLGAGAGLSTQQGPAGSQQTLLLNGTGAHAVNRGFGNEGLYLRAGKEYEGYLLLAPGAPGRTAKVTVSLHAGGAEVASATVTSTAQANFTKVDFKLTPRAGAECAGVSADAAHAAGISCPLHNTYNPDGGMSDRSAHICVQCGGEFRVALSSDPAGAPARIAFASLQPGAWGRYKGLPVRADAAEALQKMGVQMIRQGGSFAGGGNMEWWNWKGPVWRRPSAVDGNWNHGMMSGWGMFEMVDLCNAMGITPFITTHCQISADDYANLVEYCWGDAGTKWGSERISDGHPDVYNVTYFELGNEMYNKNFVEQVQAMEAKATSLGMPKTLYYAFPNNQGPTGDDATRAAALGLGDHLLVDIHDGAMGGVGAAKKVFAQDTTKAWGAINLETNCGDHTVHRMLEEAKDLNQFFVYPESRLHGRAGSFCMERSGYNEAGLNDQGISFFLPNMTWLQPPGYVHAMVAATAQPYAVNFTASGDCGDVAGGTLSAQASDDGRTVVVRFVNDAATPQNVSIQQAASATAVEATTMAWPDTKAANTPGEPEKIAPRPLQTEPAGTVVAGHSYTAFVLHF